MIYLLRKENVGITDGDTSVGLGDSSPANLNLGGVRRALASETRGAKAYGEASWSAAYWSVQIWASLGSKHMETHKITSRTLIYPPSSENLVALVLSWCLVHVKERARKVEGE